MKASKAFAAVLLVAATASSTWTVTAYATLIPEHSNRFLRFIKVWSKKIGTAADEVGGVVKYVPGQLGQIGSAVQAGGKVLVKIDPSAASFYDGRITVQYDPTLVAFNSLGWFGDWGFDPTLPPPALDPGPEGTPWNLQRPNPSLTSTVVLSSGTIQIDWNWGLAGHTAATSDHFDFFGLEFIALANTTFDALDTAIALPENSYFVGDGVTSPALQINHCTARTGGVVDPSGGVLVELCGDDVPEPSTWSLISIAGLGALSVFVRKRRASSSATSL